MSGGSKSHVYSRWQYQKRVLSPSWHISWYCLCTWPSRLYFNTSKSYLEPSYDLHLSGVYVCFSTKRRLFYFPSLIFPEQDHIIFVGLFIKICNIPSCYQKYECNICLYSVLTEAEFNGTIVFRTSTWMIKTHSLMDNFCIPGVIKAYYNMWCHLVYWLLPAVGERNILESWVVRIKAVTIFSKKYVMKIWVEALTFYSTFLKFLHFFVADFFLSLFVALQKLGQKIIWWL